MNNIEERMQEILFDVDELDVEINSVEIKIQELNKRIERLLEKQREAEKKKRSLMIDYFNLSFQKTTNEIINFVTEVNNGLFETDKYKWTIIYSNTEDRIVFALTDKQTNKVVVVKVKEFKWVELKGMFWTPEYEEIELNLQSFKEYFKKLRESIG